MSRLTDKDSYCFMSCSKDYGGTDSIGENCKLYKACFERKMYDKLKHYEDLEEAGRLIELPCKVGDTVYEVQNNTDACDDCSCYSDFYGLDPICDKNLHSISPRNEDMPICDKQFLEVISWTVSTLDRVFDHLDDFGERIFLTKAEAEAKLAELKGDSEER